MGYGRYIGYVGALAVALGVGAAVATTQASRTPCRRTPARSPRHREKPHRQIPRLPLLRRQRRRQQRMATSSPNTWPTTTYVCQGRLGLARLAGAVSKIIGGGHGAPGGGAAKLRRCPLRNQRWTATPRNLAITTGLPASGEGDADLSPPKAPKRPLHRARRAHADPAVRRPQRRSVRIAPHGRTISPGLSGRRCRRSPLAPDAAGPAMKSLVAPPTRRSTLPSSGSGRDLGGTPHLPGGCGRACGGRRTERVPDAVRPGSPAQSPVLWTVLAFVRDEFERPFIPNCGIRPNHVKSRSEPESAGQPGRRSRRPVAVGLRRSDRAGLDADRHTDRDRIRHPAPLPRADRIAGPGSARPAGIPKQ